LEKSYQAVSIQNTDLILQVSKEKNKSLKLIIALIGVSAISVTAIFLILKIK
jgi:hypothetical protein